MESFVGSKDARGERSDVAYAGGVLLEGSSNYLQERRAQTAVL